MIRKGAFVTTETYVGPMDRIVELEIEDFVFGLLNELTETELNRDEFHEVYFLHGGWGDAREFVLGVFRDYGLEW